MKKAVVGSLALVGCLGLLVAGVVAVVALGVVLGKGAVSSGSVLELDLEQSSLEYVPDDPLAKVMFEKELPLRDVLEALERASEDDRVVGVMARVGAGGMGLARIQEIRDAVIAFRSSGKPAVAFAETFGEFGPGNGGYYLATAFDEIHLQPSGDVGLTGLLFESSFLRGTLEKIGVTPRMDHRYEYKNAMNTYTEEAFTAAHREATEAIMASQFSQMVSGIAEARGLGEERVRELFDNGPYLGQEAVDADLVDSLSYLDEVMGSIERRVGRSVTYVGPASYVERAGRPYRCGTKVALIYGVGAVVRGGSGYDPVLGELTMGSDTVAGAFRDALEDDGIEAVLFRVDSPGGSYVASDTIWREVVRLREAGKPVVVSMGDVAGSGGYFVAIPATRIVAQPGTITASIGVLSGKMLTSGMWEKLGLSWDDVQTSDNATMWTGTHDYTEAEWSRFQAWLDRIYEDFTGKVAEGRGLPLEEVLEVARGRVWTGEDARARGLVDELGGYTVALRAIRELLELPDDAPIRLEVLPARRSLLQVILDQQTLAAGADPHHAALSRALHLLQPLARLAVRLGMVDVPGVLVMPDLQAPR